MVSTSTSSRQSRRPHPNPGQLEVASWTWLKKRVNKLKNNLNSTPTTWTSENALQLPDLATFLTKFWIKIFPSKDTKTYRWMCPLRKLPTNGHGHVLSLKSHQTRKKLIGFLTSRHFRVLHEFTWELKDIIFSVYLAKALPDCVHIFVLQLGAVSDKQIGRHNPSPGGLSSTEARTFLVNSRR